MFDKGKIMSQNLTQPEEIDRILMARESRNMSLDSPLSDECQSGISIQNIKCGGVAKVADHSCDTEHAKSTHGFCESLPYVWSM